MNHASRDGSRIAKLAKQNPAAALVAARKIGDPDVRSQDQIGEIGSLSRRIGTGQTAGHGFTIVPGSKPVR